ncbi:MAG: gliding motility-associated C-terminal domain-containing protein, partial [Bacteroidota bacterium]
VSGDLSELVLIDSVLVTGGGFTYFDDGSFNGETLDEDTEYCYFVTAFGAYDNSPLIPEPLINRSQILCAQPRDVVPPCTPLALSLGEFNCEDDLAQQTCAFDDYENTLEWEVDPSPNCDEDIESFNVYFSLTGAEDEYELIGNTVDNFFVHSGLTGYKGCYRISAVDRSSNESDLTEPVCADNCPNYQLPNVFTPNNDGVNDVFTPLFSNPADPIMDFDNANCPRFVREVVLTIFDRSGKNVFNYNSNDSESGILINWNGKTNNGTDLPSGLYFYSADVEFDVLASSDNKQELSGWVQILR